MSRQSFLLLLGVAFLLVLALLGGGAWWYLFGTNEVESAKLVPANTIFFASIPNAAALLEGYQTSQAKTLLGSANMKPLRDSLTNLVNPKNIDLFQDFAPNLSGQSFIAVTHFDPDHPEKVGLIAAMKPKAGLGDFGTFVEKVKATWPDIIKQSKTGTGNVAGVDYQWIQGPDSPDKICVAQVGGWIVTAWGEASLQDWLERYKGKSTTSSLAKDINYVKAVASTGEAPTTLLYVNYHLVIDLLQKQMQKTNPLAGDYLAQKLAPVGGAAVGTRFENGEIVDRFSLTFPHPAQVATGMGVGPCAFDTLKFTGPDTRFYWASTMNWKQYAKNLLDQATPSPHTSPIATNGVNFLQNWTRASGLDGEHDIVESLGSEVSIQAEWPADATYPEVGLFVKLDHPETFKPVIAAIINSVRQAYVTTGTIKELSEGGQHFAALEFNQPSILNPTITEDGDYFGLFLSENQAVRSFKRDASAGLAHNANFVRQIGDKRNGAAQILFLDSPYVLDRAYRTAMPYLTFAEMFNKDIAGYLAGKELPPDLGWLAPIGTWSCVITPDEEGIQGYSVSGIGNQGIFLSIGIGGTVSLLQSLGVLPKQTMMPGSVFLPGTPPVPAPLGGPVPPMSPNTGGAPFPALPPPPVLSNPNAADSAGAIIYITSESKILFDQTPVPTDQIGDYLKARKAANQGLKLAVKVDRNSSPDILSTVMDAGASAGFGVLPYAYTSGADSVPPATNAAPVTPSSTPLLNSTNADGSPITPASTH
jgi:hypothetical protein